MPKKKEEEKQPEHYTISKWRGSDNFECAYCPFSTLQRETIYKHYIARHAPPPEPPKVTVPTFNRFGREIEPDQNPLNVEGE